MEDSTYKADYHAALRMLLGPVSQWDGPLPSIAESVQTVTTPPHPFNPDNVHDVLSRLSFQKTTHPLVKDVLYQGISIGRAARNPFGPGWVASCNGRVLYWSLESAALALYQDWRQCDEV